MPYLNVTEAKNKLTSIRREALTGREFILVDAKRKNDPMVSLVSTELLDELCQKSTTFSFEWVDKPINSNKTYSLWNKETAIYGIGSSENEAKEDFVNNIQEYAAVYFEDLPYYLSNNNPNREHYCYCVGCFAVMVIRRNCITFSGLNRRHNGLSPVRPGQFFTCSLRCIVHSRFQVPTLIPFTLSPLDRHLVTIGLINIF